MRKGIFIYSILLAASVPFVNGQSNDPVVMTVGSDQVKLSEFKSMYYKNLPKDSVKSPQALNNYLKLFIDFRLKVDAARDAHIDTTASFRQEMSQYRQKLADPFMHDKDMEDFLVKQAYDRMLTDVHAAHILLRVNPDDSPADTLRLYRKMEDIRDMIIKKKITFENAAKKYSDDTLSGKKGGDLGYFTALEMVYPFECAAYDTKPGEVSKIIRTKFGYHIVKVIDTKPDAGEVQVAHIAIRLLPKSTSADSAKAKAKIDSIYDMLKQGMKFSELARRYSQEPSSNRSGGILKPFRIGRMPATFENAAFALKNKGDYSQPILTYYGWHILMLVNKKPDLPFDSVKDELTAKVEKDGRYELTVTALADKILKKNNYKEFPKAKEAMYRAFDSSFYKGKWTTDKAKDMKEPIFSLGDKTYTQQDFAEFAMHNQMNIKKNLGGEYAVNELYPKFVQQTALKYRNDRLETDFPDFAEMLNEYRDGIMLFDITDKMVWSKALKDTAGLKKYYEDTKNNNMWPERADASVYTCSDKDVAKEVKKLIKEGKSDRDILKQVNQKNASALTIDDNHNAPFMKKDNATVDANWKKGLSGDKEENGKIVFVNVRKLIAPQPKSFEETRGTVTTDYQNYLMTKWLSDLKAKYPVQVNNQVLQQVLN